MKLNPVRASLAIGSVGATIYMIVVGISVPEAWWIIVTGLAMFYVDSQRGNNTPSNQNLGA